MFAVHAHPNRSASLHIEHFETSFEPRPQGLLLTSWTIGENGRSEPGHRPIYTDTYRTADVAQLPEDVAVILESHHEVRRYTLSAFTVKTSK